MRRRGRQCNFHSSPPQFTYPVPVANVDQAFLIFAMENPKPNFLLLDRFLIMMKQQEIPAVICFNKKDVGEKEEWKSFTKSTLDVDIV